MNKMEKALSLNFFDECYSTNEFIKSEGNISAMEEGESTLTTEEFIHNKIIYQGSNLDELINQFRDIRTALSKQKSNNIIMITSVDNNSGTSFFARNLAAVTAFDAYRTSLLVDCNIDNPSVATTFDLGGRKGLLDYVFDTETREEDIIHSVGIKRFRSITAGEMRLKNDECFTHPKFRSLLFSLKSRYQDRSIFLDSPPLQKSADARILLDICDQVILVAPFGKVDAKKLASISKLIPQGKLSGLVINDYIY